MAGRRGSARSKTTDSPVESQVEAQQSAEAVEAQADDKPVVPAPAPAEEVKQDAAEMEKLRKQLAAAELALKEANLKVGKPIEGPRQAYRVYGHTHAKYRANIPSRRARFEPQGGVLPDRVVLHPEATVQFDKLPLKQWPREDRTGQMVPNMVDVAGNPRVVRSVLVTSNQEVIAWLDARCGFDPSKLDLAAAKTGANTPNARRLSGALCVLEARDIPAEES